MGRKKENHDLDEKQVEEPEFVTIHLINDERKLIKYHMDSNVRIKFLIKMFCKSMRKDASEFSFFYNGEKLTERHPKSGNWQTPKTLSKLPGNTANNSL
jgi:predicted restriction endonuclease